MLKKTFFLLTVVLLPLCIFSQVITPDYKDAEAGSWYCFRNSFHLDSIPDNIDLSIAADTKYWLWVNGELEIREGGLKRGPNPADTYYDRISSVKNLKPGKNTVAILVWYFGKDGFSHRNTDTPGITFNLKSSEKEIKLSHKWKTLRHPAFYIPQGDTPNYRLAESNIGFDSGKDIDFISPDYNDKGWKNARIISLKDAGWNNLKERPVPQWKDYGLKSYEKVERSGDSVFAFIPYNAQVTPYMKIKSKAGNRITIKTDNYNGGSATNVFAEYITKDGVQEFECKGWMNGHYIIYDMPSGVEVIELCYRETGYDTEFKGRFICDDPKLNSLWNKSQRTLYITMRDTYMDCPDRERAQWWGDVVNELGEAFYALDEKAHLLTKKGICELIDWQREDSTIFSPVPAGNYDSELPMQMLASVGYYGFWTYYMGTGDDATIRYVYPGVKKYMHLWKTDKDGFVIPRSGGWTWGDWGVNRDMELLFNQWYIIALQGYEQISLLLGETKEAQWAADVYQKLKTAFHLKYWNGEYYMSPQYKDQPDDRAQALAVVSGTLPEELYDKIRPFFSEHYNASPYMEKYVLEALCKMGYHQDALNRMKHRYSAMIESPLTTLWEGWGSGGEGFGGGTINHAWSGGPLTILSQYIAGIETSEPGFSKFKVEPNPGHLNHIYTVVPLCGNREIVFELNKDKKKCNMRLNVPQGSNCEFIMPKGYSLAEINGKVIDDLSVILGNGEWRIELIK